MSEEQTSTPVDPNAIDPRLVKVFDELRARHYQRDLWGWATKLHKQALVEKLRHTDDFEDDAGQLCHINPVLLPHVLVHGKPLPTLTVEDLLTEAEMMSW